MKKLIIFFIGILITGVSFCQSSNTFKYVINANGGIVLPAGNIQTQLDSIWHKDGTMGMWKWGGTATKQYFVYDADKNGYLEELQVAITDARSYVGSFVEVASGMYSIDTSLFFTVGNAYTEVRGDNTILQVRNGYTASAIDITTTGDLRRLKISGLSWRENTTTTSAWNGINVTIGTNGYLQMSSFTDLEFKFCKDVIHVVLTGSGWMNANTFTRIVAHRPVTFLNVDRTGGSDGDYFDGNIFTDINVQANAANTTYGIVNLYGKYNKFTNFNFWDGTNTMYGAIFKPKSRNNEIIGAKFDAALYIDSSTLQSNKITGVWANGIFAYYREYGNKLSRVLHRVTNTGNIDGAVGITAAMLENDILYYNGDSAIDITANPAIPDSYDGHQIIIIGSSNTNTLKFNNGNNLRLINGTAVTLGIGDSIVFIYIASIGTWQQIIGANT
jgi:hypothetical protein